MYAKVDSREIFAVRRIGAAASPNVAPVTGFRIDTIGPIPRKGRFFGGEHRGAPEGKLGTRSTGWVLREDDGSRG
jgi:hypothetical protein